jgi:cell division protein FtsB
MEGKMENSRTILVIAIITFVVGLIIGYGVFGDKKEEKADVKQVLTGAIQDIEAMEEENKDLKADLEKARRDKVARENRQLKEQIAKTQKENEGLQAEVSKLSGQVAHTGLQLEATEELRSTVESQKKRIAGLEKENQDLLVIIDTINSLTEKHDLEAPDEPSVEAPEQPAEAVQAQPAETAPGQTPEESMEREAAPAGAEEH